jgi:glucosyl-dolichyl phosphate glucuronosyltransferase
VVIENAETKGLSGARNTGITTAQGALIAFLDDDAAAAPDWLHWLTAWHADERVIGSGGTLEPWWVSGAPRWFPEEFNWVVGCSYRGLPDTTSVIRNPLGGSMCIRREVFEAVGGFRAGIGRVGTRPFGCEETELAIRARQRWPERVFLYEPRAMVRHRVPDGRGRWSYFHSRCYAEGLSKAYVAHFVGARDGLSAERSYTMKTLPEGVVRGVADAVLHRDPYGFGRAGAIVVGLGYTAAGYLMGKLTGQTAIPALPASQRGTTISSNA